MCGRGDKLTVRAVQREAGVRIGEVAAWMREHAAGASGEADALETVERASRERDVAVGDRDRASDEAERLRREVEHLRGELDTARRERDESRTQAQEADRARVRAVGLLRHPARSPRLPARW